MRRAVNSNATALPLAFRAETDLPDQNTNFPQDVEGTQALLERNGYWPDRALATVTFLSLKMGRPLFLEGEAGVGKTEIAKTLAQALGRKLIRLQCYEGLDSASALYEWNVAGQMIAIRLAEAACESDRARIAQGIVGPPYPVRRPLFLPAHCEPDSEPIFR